MEFSTLGVLCNRKLLYRACIYIVSGRCWGGVGGGGFGEGCALHNAEGEWKPSAMRVRPASKLTTGAHRLEIFSNRKVGQ